MNSFRLFSRVSLSVCVSIVVTLSTMMNTAAAAQGSWASQPSWSATEGGSSTSPARKSAKSDLIYQISPYSPGSNNLALDVGQVFLMGNLGNSYSDSLGMQAHYTYGVSDLFGFDSSFGYSSHEDGKFSMTTLLTGLRMNLSWYDKVIPYAVFGMGFYRPSFQVSSSQDAGITPSSISPVLFGVHMGPGVDLELTKQFFFGAALTFHDIFGSERSLPNGSLLDVGGTYTTFLLHAGVSF